MLVEVCGCNIFTMEVKDNLFLTHLTESAFDIVLDIADRGGGAGSGRDFDSEETTVSANDVFLWEDLLPSLNVAGFDFDL